MKNRAFIKRDSETKKLLISLVENKEIELDQNSYYDQEYWLFKSRESFHVDCKEKKVIFQDQRLPSFELSFEYIQLEN